ncbi:glycerol-3-phosphate 1-O-acyltransferase PlsY [Zavarzinella formosa]|uniref:glycerol-3-phosphate 1-O-acyltransferase PlsY n=1 Tax=Zavarzinella formosa TaxID=360055 RepID=UPI00031D23C8|nr:glycerol-3-phosphate 1-O-acyltransferase PlsY [Zavarzinella formosa]
MTLALIVLTAAYLIGSIPFGYLIARSRGVDIFKHGSGNIGATNVGRVLGRKLGLLVFGLDLLKGAVPVFIAGLLPPEAQTAFGSADVLHAASGVLGFLGHMFPVFLKFRGGKGVATGAGVMLVLAPWPMVIAFVSFLALVSSTRYISLGSIVAVMVFAVARLVSVREPFSPDYLTTTLFCLIGPALLILKHRTNIKRLMNGTENQVEAKTMWETLARLIHVMSLGLWFGGAVMFNFVAAPAIFESFKQVVAGSPSDRTAGLDIAANTSDQQKADLASALAGSAVGPIFPKFFALQSVCAIFVLFTAFGWRKFGGIHRWRFLVVLLAGLTVAVGWPISIKVSALRLERLANPELRADFVAWHLVSLALSALTALLAGVAMAMASKMPERGKTHEPAI